MTSISLLLRLLPAAAFAAALILSGCTRKPAPKAEASVDASATPASAPTPAAVDGESTPTAEAVATRPPRTETALFFSERFLPPGQRLERRQGRILKVLETSPTAPAEQES